MSLDHGFIAPMLGLLTGKKAETKEKHGNDTILDNLVIVVIEVGALVVGFRFVRSMTDNEIMGVIGSLVVATTAVEIAGELASRFQWIPRDTETANPVPVPTLAPVAAPVLPTPVAPFHSPFHILFNRP